jgi:hypothetical protein
VLNGPAKIVHVKPDGYFTVSEGLFVNGVPKGRKIHCKVKSCYGVVCAGCGKEYLLANGSLVNKKEKVGKCSGCKKMWYCDSKCQAADFTRHKPICQNKKGGHV